MQRVYTGRFSSGFRFLFGVLAALALVACGDMQTVRSGRSRTASAKGGEVVLYAMGLIDTGYRFGGKNPEAGFDCSGMVSYIYQKAIGLKVSGSAADIARQGKRIARNDLRPGDLVFFNTRNAPFSHVGIYVGDGRFIHAPSTNGRVRIDTLERGYFAQRFEAARAYFDF
jgi:cell wall-associated NlpC family hydrolase